MTPTYIIINGRYVRVKLIESRGYRVYLVQAIATEGRYIRSLSAITYDFSHRITEGQVA